MSYTFSYICPWSLQTTDCNTSTTVLPAVNSHMDREYTMITRYTTGSLQCVSHLYKTIFFLKNIVQDASLLSSSSSRHGTASNLQFCSIKWEVVRRLGSNYGLHETVQYVHSNSPTQTGRVNLRLSWAPHQNWPLSSIRSTNMTASITEITAQKQMGKNMYEWTSEYRPNLTDRLHSAKTRNSNT
jgi:hypothetical protein